MSFPRRVFHFNRMKVSCALLYIRWKEQCFFLLSTSLAGRDDIDCSHFRVERSRKKYVPGTSKFGRDDTASRHKLFAVCLMNLSKCERCSRSFSWRIPHKGSGSREDENGLSRCPVSGKTCRHKVVGRGDVKAHLHRSNFKRFITRIKFLHAIHEAIWFRLAR